MRTPLALQPTSSPLKPKSHNLSTFQFVACPHNALPAEILLSVLAVSQQERAAGDQGGARHVQEGLQSSLIVRHLAS